MAGQREELYSLKGATVPYLAHPDIQLLLINNTSSKILALSTSTDNAKKLNCYQHQGVIDQH